MNMSSFLANLVVRLGLGQTTKDWVRPGVAGDLVAVGESGPDVCGGALVIGAKRVVAVHEERGLERLEELGQVERQSSVAFDNAVLNDLGHAAFTTREVGGLGNGRNRGGREACLRLQPCQTPPTALPDLSSTRMPTGIKSTTFADNFLDQGDDEHHIDHGALEKVEDAEAKLPEFGIAMEDFEDEEKGRF
ncbi:hypothetical protein HDU86_007548 [Geranomyces michiganensis]|nr:hypothetical protein HDU86_007548 [Geranomyces michiganensis]